LLPAPSHSSSRQPESLFQTRSQLFRRLSSLLSSHQLLFVVSPRHLSFASRSDSEPVPRIPTPTGTISQSSFCPPTTPRAHHPPAALPTPVTIMTDNQLLLQEAQAKINRLEQELDQSRQEVEDLHNRLSNTVSEGDHVALKVKYESLYQSYKSMVEQNLHAAQNIKQKDPAPDTKSLFVRGMCDRMTGINVIGLRDDVWYAAIEAMHGRVVPDPHPAPDQWTFRSSVRPIAPNMLTVDAACLAVLIATEAPQEPQEPLLAHLCTLLAGGGAINEEMVHLVLTSITYRQSEADQHDELAWLVAVVVALTTITESTDATPFIAPVAATRPGGSFRQPFRRLIELFQAHPLSTERLRSFCQENGAVCREPDLGFLEGPHGCVLLDFKNCVLQIVSRAGFSRCSGGMGVVIHVVRTPENQRVEFTTSEEETRNMFMKSI
ncbi:hypothetical protein QBC39DRAFT_409348, partial [Podospora conica]